MENGMLGSGLSGLSNSSLSRDCTASLIVSNMWAGAIRKKKWEGQALVVG